MDTITLDLQEQVFLIGLNRPKQKNAFSSKMLSELSTAFTQYEDDPQARCALLFAHGDSFTTGLDLADVGPKVLKGIPLFPQDAVDPLGMGRTRTKPLVIAIQGWCLTIGVELALAADVRIAASNAIFAQMEVQRGIMPFGGGTIRWPQVAGWGNAMRWLLTGDRFNAKEAYRIGLVQELVEPDKLQEVSFGIARRIAEQAPIAVRETMRSAKIALQSDQAAAEILIDQVKELMLTKDAHEGMMSFIERRPARFKGQ